MKHRFGFAVAGVAGLAAITVAFAQSARSNEKQPEMPAMPGMTPERMEYMQACMEAGMPGEMHAYLAKGAGKWEAKTTMWMAPDADPMQSTGSSTVTSIMDGRYVKCEMTGDMPGMGTYNGFGIYGYDNVSETFQCTWIDNHGSAMMIGTGELSSDGKTLTWKFPYTCPKTKKPMVMREVEKVTGKDTKTLAMFGTDPITGKEYKMMEIALTRKGGSERAGAPTR